MYCLSCHIKDPTCAIYFWIAVPKRICTKPLHNHLTYCTDLIQLSSSVQEKGFCEKVTRHRRVKNVWHVYDVCNPLKNIAREPIVQQKKEVHRSSFFCPVRLCSLILSLRLFHLHFLGVYIYNMDLVLFTDNHRGTINISFHTSKIHAQTLTLPFDIWTGSEHFPWALM